MESKTRSRSSALATPMARRIRRGIVRRAERWLGGLGLVAPRPAPRSAPRPMVEVPAPEMPAPEVTAQPAPVQPQAAVEAPEPVGTAAGLDPAAVQAILDDMVRPALQADGGDITLVGVVGGEVHVQLVGACSSCPSSILTMKMGIERLLEEELPGFERLVQVGGPDLDVHDDW